MVTVPPSKKEASGIEALPYLLLPLAGPEEFDLEVYNISSMIGIHKFDITIAGPRKAPRVLAIPAIDQTTRV